MNNVNIGNCGEYFVAGELERRGFSVGVPMSNVKDFDILAINNKTYKQYAIQVKTTSKPKRKWLLDKKNENLVSDNIVYIFVKLNNLGVVEYHVVPSFVVAKRIKDYHEIWLNTPGKKGQKREDNKMRTFEDENKEFLDKWEILDN